MSDSGSPESEAEGYTNLPPRGANGAAPLSPQLQGWWARWSVVSELLVKAGDEALQQQRRGVDWTLPNPLKTRIEVLKSLRSLVLGLMANPGTSRVQLSQDLKRVREGHDELINLRGMFQDAHEPELGWIMNLAVKEARNDPSIAPREDLSLEQCRERTRTELRELERALADVGDWAYLEGLSIGFDNRIYALWEFAEGDHFSLRDEGSDFYDHISWLMDCETLDLLPSELLDRTNLHVRRLRLRSLYLLQRDGTFERLYAPLERLGRIVQRVIDTDLVRRGYGLGNFAPAQYAEWEARIGREIDNCGNTSL